jgi:hypothetical protein
MNDCPAAFPVPEDADHAGMTLRDWFWQALAGLVTDSRIGSWENVAIAAYGIANAMLKERDK